MEGRCSVNLRAADLGRVNQAFAASVDESEQESQRLAMDRSLITTKVNSVKDEKCFEQASSDIIQDRCNNMELKPDGGQPKPDGDLIEPRNSSNISMEFNQEPIGSSADLSSSINEKDSISVDYEGREYSNITQGGVFKETELRHRNTQGNVSKEAKGESHVLKNSDELNYGLKTYDSIVAGLQKDKGSQLLATDADDVNELQELNVSMMSDGTEFYYTPEVSPGVSPAPLVAVERKKSYNVTFDETSIEIGQDSLENSEDIIADPSLEEDVLDGVDQEFLRHLVDPTQKYFVCISCLFSITRSRVAPTLC